VLSSIPLVMAQRWTLILLGEPGSPARSLVIPSWLVAAAVVLATALLGVGIWLGFQLGAPERAGAAATSVLPPLTARPARGQDTSHTASIAVADEPEDDHSGIDVPPLDEVPDIPPGPVVTPDHAGRRLRLLSLHTGDRIDVVPFDDGGRVRPGAFAAIRHVMRCRVTGTEVPVDRHLVELLLRISEGHRGSVIQLVSGYRTPGTIGTRDTSYHAMGKAADIRIGGVSVLSLRSLALQLTAGGVGLYRRDHFVHVDVREQPYRWDG